MYIISKEFHFSASHILSGLPEGHQCGRMHGHNYVIVLFLKSDTLNKTGFVQDYGELKEVKEWIDETLDHRHLNDALPFNPTAENMAKHIYTYFKGFYPKLAAVEVWETPKTKARYES